MIVLDSTRAVLERARHISLDPAAIQRWSVSISPDQLRAGSHDLLRELPSDRNALANLILLISALNFCFWSDDPIHIQWRGTTYRGFSAMLVSLLLAVRAEPAWADPSFWLSLTPDELHQVLAGTGRLLLMPEREAILRETATTLLDRFDGQFAHAVESVNHRAWPLAVLLMTNFDSFRDVASHDGQPVYILKRAQICAADLSMAWNLHGHNPLDGLDELTAFADYRIPQALRHLGILRLNDELAQSIDSARELPKDADEEIEIRAASIQAVDQMAAALKQIDKRAAPWEIDWYLWGLSHDPAVRANHHRTRTIYY